MQFNTLRLHFVLFFSKKIWTGRLKPAPPAPRVVPASNRTKTTFKLPGVCWKGPVTCWKFLELLHKNQGQCRQLKLHKCSRHSWNWDFWTGRGIFLNTLKQSCETKYQSTFDCLILADWMGVYAAIHLEAKLLGNTGQNTTKYERLNSTEAQFLCPGTHKFWVKHHVQPWSQKFRLWLKRFAKISWDSSQHWGKRRRWRLDFTYYYAECVIPENHVG